MQHEIRPNLGLRLFNSMLRDPVFSFNYFNRDKRISEKHGGKRWEIMIPQHDYLMTRFISDRMVIACGRSVGKCFKYNELIENEDGTLSKIKDMPTFFKVQTIDHNNNIIYSDAIKEYNGYEKCYKLTLINGQTQTVNEEHQYLTYDGWKKIIDLTDDDYVCQPKYINNIPTIQVDDTEMKLLGYLLGDGCISKNACDFTNINPSVVNDMRNIVKHYECRLKKKSRKNNKAGNYRITMHVPKKNGHKIKRLIKELGLYNTNSHTKFIPDKYFKCSNEQVALLINRLFECDGWVDKRGVSYCTVSYTMISQIQYLLLRFGIHSTIRKKNVKYNNSYNTTYILNITRGYVEEFYNNIGIFTKLNESSLTDSNTYHKNKIIIPDDMYEELRSLQSVTCRELDTHKCRLRKTRKYTTTTENKLLKFLNINNIDPKKYEWLYKNVKWVKVKTVEYDGKHDTYGINVPETNTHIINGIFSHNTSSIIHLVGTYSMANPGKGIGYIVKNQKHATGFIDNLLKYYNTSKFGREFLLGYDKKDRIFTLHNGVTIEIRIVGHDKTGATSVVGLHVDLLILDEAQLLDRVLLHELLPTMQKGCDLVIAGVPNDIRDSVLYYGCANKDYMYMKYSSVESDDWDDAKEKTMIDNYGGKETPSWRNLVLGEWGDAAAAVFKPSKLVDGLKDITSFRYKKLNEGRFDNAVSQLNLPPILKKYDKYILGGDMGYTMNSPMYITILGEYLDNDPLGGENGKVSHYDVVYRLEIQNMLAYDGAKTINYLLTYFNCKHAAIDSQSVGMQVYGDLCNKEIFPQTFARNKQYMLPIIFGKPIIMGKISTIDQATKKEIEEDIVVAMKVGSTIKLNEIIETLRFHIAFEDARTDEYEDLITILQAETQTPRINKLHPMVYSNSVNDHCVDALRCCALVIFLIIENGLFLGDNGYTPIKPKKMGNSIFNRGKINHANRRRR